MRERVIAEARTWLRTPFVHQACVKGAGVGCGTFLIAVYGACGVAVPAIASLPFFSPDWHCHTCEERYLHVLEQFAQPVNKPRPGDIALFRMGRLDAGVWMPWSHSAIVVDWPLVIHAYWRRGVDLDDASKAPLMRKPVMFLSPFSSDSADL